MKKNSKVFTVSQPKEAYDILQKRSIEKEVMDSDLFVYLIFLFCSMPFSVLSMLLIIIVI